MQKSDQGKKAYVSKIYFSVDGDTEWATTANVTLQDTAEIPVVGATVAVAGLAANAMFDEGDTKYFWPRLRMARDSLPEGPRHCR